MKIPQIKKFNRPTALPADDKEALKWQDENRSWWEANSMRYDWKDAIPHQEFSPEFYKEIDSRFFSRLREFMPWKKIPFDSLINFHSLSRQDVLEIGVGNGSHAQLLAQYAHSFTGIDLTDYAVKSTQERLRHFGLRAKIARMDAEHMSFADDSFDLVWSWGVIHHSSDPRKIIKEMARVLRPGGRAITMVYHRSVWNYYLMGGLFWGVLRGGFLKYRSLHDILQANTDGALARYYISAEWADLVSNFFNVKKVFVFGQKAEEVPLPGGKIKNFLMSVTPDSFTRFLTNQLRFGSFLVTILEKK